MRHSHVLLITGLSMIGLFFVACGERLDITEPERGSMIIGDDPVTIKGTTSASKVTIFGETVNVSGGEFSYTMSAQGLGFVAVKADDEVAVRSWHQGSFADPDQAISNTIEIIVDQAALQAHVLPVISRLLTDSDLASMVTDPITASGAFAMDIDVLVTSAIVEGSSMAVSFNDDSIEFEVVMMNVQAGFITQSPCLVVEGSIAYPSVSITGSVAIADNQVAVSITDVVLNNPTIQVPGVPQDISNAVLSETSASIEPALETVATQAIETAMESLLLAMQPSLEGDITSVVNQEVQLLQLSINASALQLLYQTSIQSTSPIIAQSNQGVWEYEVTSVFSANDQVKVLIGPQLINQLAFAMWDGGMLDTLAYTQAELETLGLPDLDFPYSKLESAEITALLPPLLQFNADGAYLDVGGIEVLLRVDTVKDTKAWTRAKIPVNLVTVDEGLRIELDSMRAIEIDEVEFEHLNVLADRGKVIGLMDTVAKGLVNSIFGSITTITLPTFVTPLMDGTTGPTVEPRVASISLLEDAWQLNIVLDMTATPDEDPVLPSPSTDLGQCMTVFEGQVSITVPERGTMIDTTSDVPVTVVTDASSLHIEAYDTVQEVVTDLSTLPASGQAIVNAPAVDGLGVVEASIDNGDMYAVRSYHQGTFLNAATYQPDTTVVALGMDALTDGDYSLAGMVEDVINGGELAPYIDSMTDTFNVALVGDIEIVTNVTHAVSGDTSVGADDGVQVAMSISDGEIAITVTLNNVQGTYASTSSVGLNASGGFSNNFVSVSGALELSPGGAQLVAPQGGEIEVVADAWDIDRPSFPPVSIGFIQVAVPSSIIDSIVDNMDDNIEQAIKDAAITLAGEVGTKFIQDITPRLGLIFDNPLSDAFRATLVDVVDNPGTEDDHVFLMYESIITADTPAIASVSQGVLERVTVDPLMPSRSTEVLIGSPVMNQLAFAAWDAGNFEGLYVSQTGLEDFGMPALEFPFNMLEGTSLGLLLPPVLEWDENGDAWLHMGGIEGTIIATGVPNTKVWTWALVPVNVGVLAGSNGRSLELYFDPIADYYGPGQDRELFVGSIEFASLSPLVERAEVLKVMETAIPAIVGVVFEGLPTFSMPEFQMDGLTGATGSHFATQVESILQGFDSWQLTVGMEGM